MKFDSTMTQLSFFYTYTGAIDGEYCFELTDKYALALEKELPWCDYTVQFDMDPLRPLQIGATVTITYVRTHHTSPRMRWEPVSWRVINASTNAE